MRWWQWAIEVAVAALVLLLVVDPLFRGWMTSRVEFKELASTAPKNSTLVVYLPGLVSDGEVSAEGLTDTWRSFGDVLLVSYRGQRIRPEEVIDAVTARLEKDSHRQIVFIGSSMGGLFASDIYARLKPDLGGRKVKFLLVATPSGAADLKPLPAWLSWLPSAVRGGPILDAISPLAMHFMVQPLTPEAGVDPAYYASRIKQARSYGLPYWLDGVRDIATHPAIQPGSLVGVKIIYVRCSEDPLVKADAYLPWKAANPQGFDRVDVTTIGHVTYAEQPALWNKVFREQLEAITQ